MPTLADKAAIIHMSDVSPMLGAPMLELTGTHMPVPGDRYAPSAPLDPSAFTHDVVPSETDFLLHQLSDQVRAISHHLTFVQQQQAQTLTELTQLRADLASRTLFNRLRRLGLYIHRTIWRVR